MARAPLTARRLLGLDRSGPAPPQTMRDQPWNPWTIPNAIGFVRGALIPVFLVLALSSDSGTDALPAVIFGVVAWSDYADGMAARITGQYSRLGALLDPIVDRMLVVSGLVVCWHFELLPHWGLTLLVVREVLVLGAGQYALAQGLDLEINWFGRLAVWPTMSALFYAMVDLQTVGEGFLYIGLAMSYVALVLYVTSTRRRMAARPSVQSLK